jgi:hypothetical protein
MTEELDPFLSNKNVELLEHDWRTERSFAIKTMRFKSMTRELDMYSA